MPPVNIADQSLCLMLWRPVAPLGSGGLGVTIWGVPAPS